MRCVYVEKFHPEVLPGLAIGELIPNYPPGAGAGDPDPQTWVRVRMKAAALNHHDLWSLKGVGLREAALPMVLGTDGAGVTDDGREVVIHSVITSPLWAGPQTHDPSRTLLSEKYPGTMAEEIWVPESNLVTKPAGWGFAEIAALPTAYLTAYNLLFDSAQIRPGERVLVQGARGGVASAAAMLARAAGAHVTVATRDERNAEHALKMGAHEVVATGERITPVDAVIETVGEATWGHSLRSLKPGGVIAVAGATSGPNPGADLNRVFFLNLRIIGTTMGSITQLREVIAFLDHSGLRPAIHAEYSFNSDSEIHAAFEDLYTGAVAGKAVLVND